ncbi:MAG: hypothetical protein K2X95_01980 [Flavobacteriaceae bacterium]|nr:hypothetical protein [Flavobacteriaceae bacterium]
MMKKSIALLGFIFLFSCQQKEKNLEPQLFVDSNIENWKKELVINGEVGTPCEKDDEKWIGKNPESYYGLPTEISLKSFDANNDKNTDYLLYFPAGNCCTGGHEEGSDFLKLIYSNGDEYLSNEKLREKIALKIENEFFSQTNTDVERTIFSVTDFSTEISGTYQLWTLADPDCCASIEGTFKYNPFTFKIQITHQNVK